MAEVALYAFDVRTGTECGDSVTVAQIMETSLRRTRHAAGHQYQRADHLRILSQ